MEEMEATSTPAPEKPVEMTSAVTVDIYDQTYHLRGQDPAYIATLAEMVDSKMRAVASGGTTVDSLRVAVLAALNIADELTRVQSKYRALSGSVSETESSLRDRTANLAGLLDSILTEERKIG
jgi:cell division protein ZapA